MVRAVTIARDGPGPRAGVVWGAAAILVGALAAGWAVGRLLRPDDEPAVVSAVRPAMGALMEIRIRGGASAGETARLEAALEAAFAEIARIDTLLSTHLPPRAGGEPEKLVVLREGLAVQQLTGGAFDVRMRPLLELWGFEGEQPRRPDPRAREAEARRLATPPATAESLLAEPGRLHFGGWGPGYAVDRALEVLRARGVAEALVNGGGEIRCLGPGWLVGVQHPRLPGALIARLAPGAMAVATSGDYERSFTQDGVAYHHLLDPRTGEPARGCRSVTVLAATCARADALATGIFVLGPERGLALVERLPGVECLIVDEAGEVRRSSGMAAYLADE